MVNKNFILPCVKCNHKNDINISDEKRCYCVKCDKEYRILIFKMSKFTLITTGSIGVSKVIARRRIYEW